MRCDCCQKILTDYEATLRHADTNEFLDTCLKCLRDTGIPSIGRTDLDPYESVDDDVQDCFSEGNGEDDYS